MELIMKDINEKAEELAKLYGIESSNKTTGVFEKENGEKILLNRENIMDVFGSLFSNSEFDFITSSYDTSDIEAELEENNIGFAA